MLKIGLIQLAVMEGRCQENMLHIKELAKKYAKDDVDLLCFPELCVSGYDFEKAQSLLEDYLASVDQEITRANEVIVVVEELLVGKTEELVLFLTRSEAAEYLEVTSESLRNWERNGLLAIKRRKNNYRTYDTEDIKRLKIIRTLRSAKYSLAAILRMLNAIDQEKQDIKSLLNPVDPDESILTACDNLIDSLEKAKSNAYELKELVKKLQQRFF